MFACWGVTLGTALAQTDEYTLLRERWHAQLSGGPALSSTDPEVLLALQTLGDSAEQHWRSMERSVTRTALWPDLQSQTDSSVITSHYTRLLAMARAYATRGSRLYGNTALADDIVAGLDWLQAMRYKPGVTRFNNWWDWEIGAPQALISTLTLMYERLSPAQRDNYLTTVDFFVPTATHRTGSTLVETGANRLDRALIVSLRGALGRSDERLRHGRDAIAQTLPYVSAGDGFYRDGSFIQHGYVAYTGSYGLVMMDSLSRLLRLLNGSSWAVTDPNVSNVYDWVEQSFRPLVRDGAMMDSVRGRAIARRSSSDHSAGRGLMASLIRLAEGAPPEQALRLKSLVKGWLHRNVYLGPQCFSGQPLAPNSACALFPLYEMSLLKTLQWDNNILPAAEASGATVFANMDRAVLRHPQFSFGLSLFSNRITAYEAGNGENLKPWWTGMGMSTLHNADQQQYDGEYWATVDPLRLAGTTTDRSSAALKNWALIKNTSNWVGGAQLNGRYAIATLDFGALNVTGSPLKGKKSWFLFGDKVIALGAAISSSNGQAVETVVENRKLNAAGSNALTVDGLLKPAAAGWAESLGQIGWAHLAGTVAGGEIGYVFPDRPTLDGRRETRSGTWQAIKSQEAADPVSAHFLSLALPHGVNPTAGSYSYVILPGRSPAQTAAFAAKPWIRVLARSTDMLAVQDQALGLVGASFLTNGSKTLALDGKPFLSSSAKASVLIREEVGGLDLSVADPTQANSGSVTVEIHRAASAMTAASAGITLLRLAPTVQFRVDLAQAAGRSFGARFQLSTPTEQTAQVSVLRSGLTLDRRTQQFIGTLDLINQSQQPLTGPMRLLLTELPAGVSLLNASGMYAGAPYLDVDAAGLAPGAKRQLPLQFSNPQRVGLSYTPRLLAGSF